MRIFILLFFLLLTKSIMAELLKPSPKFLPDEVISIQLEALKNNNFPYENAGIEQAWEFAHPSNREYTGPLTRFIKMMLSPSYSIMLGFQDYKIFPIKQNDFQSLFFVELKDKNGKINGIQWIVEKVKNKGNFYNCWMTINVSKPIFMSKSA